LAAEGAVQETATVAATEAALAVAAWAVAALAEDSEAVATAAEWHGSSTSA
jgi:hypothetical protein